MRTFIKSVLFLFSAIFVITLTGCRTPGGPVAQVPEKNPATPEFSREAYADLSSQEGRVFWIDSDASEVRLFLWRGGLMAEKGHNHVMRVKQMEGAAFLPADMLEDDPRIDIVFRAKDIEVDPMPLRKEIGGAFVGTGMTPKAAEDTREHMLGEKVLNPDRFPTIGIHTEKVYGELPKLVLDARITLHGIQRQQLIPITAHADGDRLTAKGAFVIQQTNFGIEPFSAMGGALYILDPIMIEFDITARTR